jgi:hypothetical protein
MDKIIPVSIALNSSILRGEIYYCLYCKAVFSQNQNLDDHIKMYHTFLSLKCQYCRKRFTKPEHLKLHITTVHGVRSKGQKICSMRITKGQKIIGPGRCYVCKLEFSEYGEYKQHMISCHQFTKTSLENIFFNEENLQKEAAHGNPDTNHPNSSINMKKNSIKEVSG